MTAIWRSWALYSYRNNIERFAGYARRVLGLTGGDEELALASIDATTAWFRSLDLPTSLRELLGLSITEEMISNMAQTASYGKTRKLGKLCVLEFEDMCNIYRNAI